jgi:hypothetical protein
LLLNRHVPACGVGAGVPTDAAAGEARRAPPPRAWRPKAPPPAVTTGLVFTSIAALQCCGTTISSSKTFKDV